MSRFRPLELLRLVTFLPLVVVLLAFCHDTGFESFGPADIAVNSAWQPVNGLSVER